MSAASAALLGSPSKNFFSPLFPEKKTLILSSSRKSLVSVSAFKIGVAEIAELANNKVLVASTLSFAIGQLSKSLAGVFNGNDIDLKAPFKSGGMPSVHSASVTAAATSLALDRGLSDAIFGMSVVFAGLVMYDAQGVRREVGRHAKILNELLKAQEMKSQSETYSLLKSGVTARNLEKLQSLKVDFTEASDNSQSSCGPLNESVGHTEIQVLAGAFLGFFLSLMVHSIL